MEPLHDFIILFTRTEAGTRQKQHYFDDTTIAVYYEFYPGLQACRRIEYGVRNNLRDKYPVVLAKSDQYSIRASEDSAVAESAMGQQERITGSVVSSMTEEAMNAFCLRVADAWARGFRFVKKESESGLLMAKPAKRGRSNAVVQRIMERILEVLENELGERG